MDDIERCCYCLKKIKHIHDVTSLECSHTFHTACVLDSHDDKCAMCRVPSMMLAANDGIATRKKKAKVEATEKQIEDDGEVAHRLQAEELLARERGERRQPQPLIIDRGSDEWNGVKQTIVGFLVEMIGEGDNPLDGIDDVDGRKSALHHFFHNQGAFRNIGCQTLRDIAGDALEHEMFQVN